MTSSRSSGLRAVYDGRSIGIRFAWFDGINAVLKAAPFSGIYISTKGHPYEKYWVFDAANIDGQSAVLANALAAAADSDRTPGADALRQVLETAYAAPDRRAFTFKFQAKICPLKTSGFLITSSYHRGVVWLARQAGGKYVPACRGWLVADRNADLFRDEIVRELALTDIEALDVVVADGEFEFKPNQGHSDTWLTIASDRPEGGSKKDKTDEVAGTVLATIRDFAHDSAPVDATSIEAVLAEMPTHEYQNEGIRFLVARNSALLADDPGLGKTRQAIIAAHIKANLVARAAADRVQIVIAAPASLLVNWQREIAMLFPDDVVAVRIYDAAARWLVCNFEMLGHIETHAKKFAVMVIDEAHYLKESGAERTRLSFEIGAQVPVRYLLTGTPVLNRELELHTLLQLSGHPVGRMSLRDFSDAYAGSKELRNNLGSVITDWMLRRKKTLVLRDLKGRQEQVQYLELDAEVRDEYNKIFSDASRFPLDRIIGMRQLLEATRASAIEVLADSLDVDDKLLVFCEYKATVSLLLEKLERFGVVSITGEDAFSKRQKAVDAFQTNPEVRVLIGTTGAAATGLNLQAANYVTFASLPWTPALRDQAESRADRQGQTRLVMSKILLFKDTLDDLMWTMLSGKSQIANEILDDDAAANAAQRRLASALRV